MFTVKTAKGTEYESDYATSLSSLKLVFIRLVGESKESLKGIQSELPFDRYPEYKKVVDMKDEGSAIKLILEP